MTTAYPLATLAPVVTATGVSTLIYSDILASLKASAQQIFGPDIYLEADSQEGQMLAIIAQAIYDCGQAAVAVYNSFSPATAVAEGLSNVVKINHIKRLVATHSQVNVTIGGQAGTLITNGIVGDVDGKRWLLPATVTIPPEGTIVSTATAELEGALTATVGAVSLILTPTAGWQTVTNSTAASPGQPIESDAELRARQTLSPSIYSTSPMEAIAASIKALPGVTYGTVYENDSNSTDANGLPAHSISVVVQGGVAADIAQTIYNKKAPGVGTFGSTSINITDISGAVRAINYYVPTEVPIKVTVHLVAGTNYTTIIASAIKTAVANFINALSIGEDLIVSRLYAPALLLSVQDSETYKINSLTAALYPSGTLAISDIVIAFTAKATCFPAYVTIILD